MNTPHTAWCARNHRCAIHLGQHQSDDIIIATGRQARAVLTRVRTGDGREHADIRIRLALPAFEPHARLRLAALLRHLTALVGPAPDSRRAG